MADTAQKAVTEDIVVTAQKRVQKVRDVPISLTVLGQKQLERAGIRNAADAIRNVPNVSLQPTELGGSTVNIRGVASTIGSPTVGVYIDETPIQLYQRGFSGNADPQIFDLDRIEVLRGPQGTLYGASSLGGTLRYISAQPSLTDYSGRTQEEVGVTDGGAPSWQVAGAYGGPIKENVLGFRLSAYYREDGGYIDSINRNTGSTARNNINDDRTVALRGALQWAVDDIFDANFGVFYQSIHRNDLPVFEVNGPGFKQTLPPFTQDLTVPQRGYDDFALPSLTMHGYFGWATLTSVTSWFKRTNNQIGDYSDLAPELVLVPSLGPSATGLREAGGATNNADNRQSAVTQEVRLSSTDTVPWLRWTVGAYYQDSRYTLNQTVREPGLNALFEQYLGTGVQGVFGIPLLPTNLSYAGNETYTDEELAGFGELSIKPFPWLEFVGGARGSRSDTSSQVIANGPFNGGPTPIANTKVRQDNETPVTPKFGLNLRPWNDGLLYFVAAKGFRPGGGNLPVPTSACHRDLSFLGISESPASYQPDTVWNYEVGYKQNLDRRLSVSGALFEIDWNRIQQNITLPDCGFSFVDNVGTARNRGFEAEINARPIDPLILTGSVGYTDARFQKTVALGPGDVITHVGDRVPLVPDWTAAVSGTYQMLVHELPVYLRADWQYRGGQTRTTEGYLVDADPYLYFQKPYDDLSLRAGVTIHGWEAAIFANNVLNNKPILFRTNAETPTTSYLVREVSLRPLTVGLTISRNF